VRADGDDATAALRVLGLHDAPVGRGEDAQ
jgi:hypothetical protein